MKTTQAFTALLILFATLFSTATTHAQSIDSEIDLDDGVLTIEGDWTRDRITVSVSPDGDEIDVKIEQFRDMQEVYEGDPARTRTRDFDIEDVDSIEIYSYGETDTILVPTSLSHLSSFIVDLGSGDDSIAVESLTSCEIFCGPGNDTVFGEFAGAINGGFIPPDFAGHSLTVFGGPGDDTIYGSAGDDYILGESGYDKLFGRSGDDIVTGGQDDDFIDGGWGDDYLYGDAGDDQLIGNIGDDNLYGGADDDDLLGDYAEGEYSDYGKLNSGGTDFLYGQAGNDTLRCDYDGKADTLVGGADADDLIYRVYSKRLITSGRGVQLFDIRNSQYETTEWERDLTPDVNFAEGDVLISRKK